MRYIQDFKKELKEILADLLEERRNQIIKYVKKKALESHWNGMVAAKSGKGARKDGGKPGRFSKRES